MSDYEETSRIVRELELKQSINEMRSVRIEDGRNTIHEIQYCDQYGEWGALAVGLARRRKGDRRDPALAGSLSLYRALVNMAERHRAAFAEKWPEYFPKATEQHEKTIRRLRRKVANVESFGRHWYDRNRDALALLESSPEAFTGASANINSAIAVLRGKEGEDAVGSAGLAQKILEEGPRVVDCGEGRTVVEAWSVVAQRALAVLRGEADDEG